MGIKQYFANVHYEYNVIFVCNLTGTPARRSLRSALITTASPPYNELMEINVRTNDDKLLVQLRFLLLHNEHDTNYATF